ncbi:hypothetical protein [Thioalkalivibrio nitratireducens]|nr:hypothetical protein [Thioalkalivibrio nitratireducens]
MWEQNQIKRTLSAPANLARVQALMREAPELHRTGLADRVCATLDFLDARGRVQRAGCLKALRASERAGQMTLPPARNSPGRGGQGRRLGVAVRHRHGGTGRWNPPRVWMRSCGPSTSSGVRPWGTSD